ncbi:MAG TPA: methyltransferase domain-containing protein [Rhizomicrobium sp.]
MNWDPKTYLAFGGERTRAAAELVARIGIDSPKRVADLGCGPGNSTALLAARWIEADAACWTPDGAYDVIYSNAALHWVSDHESLLPRLLSYVASGGVLAFQVPRNFREPSHTIAQELSKEPHWADRIARVRDWWNVLEPEGYYGIFEPLAQSIDIWETRYLQTLEGGDAVYRWVLGSALRPLADAIEGEERETFLAEYRGRAARAYPQRDSGVTLFPFQRLFCVATKR